MSLCSDIKMFSMSAIKLSFTPGEIIAPGTTLELRTSRAVDPESAKVTVRLFKAGKQVPIVATTQGNLIRIPTDNLSPATYQVSVGKLLDSQGNPLTEPTVVPVVVGGLRGSIPSGFRAEHAVHVAVGDLIVTRLRPGESKPDGTEYVELVKAVNKKTGEHVTLSFDGQGNQLDDGPGLLAKVQRRRTAKFGRVHESLWNILEQSADTDIVNVVVWPKIKGSPITYKKPNDRVIDAPLPEELKHLNAIQGQKAKVMNLLGKMNISAGLQDGDDGAPSVALPLTVGDIRKLAESDDVGLLSFDERKPVLDLSNSIAVARSNLAQNLGFTGAGIRVAVFEGGPSNTTNLVYAARYQASPPASDHARLTSACIKNVEPNKPHGHAPNCDLYSANSYDNAALRWAVAPEQVCTVISQSFHQPAEQTSPTLSGDDLLKDYLALHYPYPTIVQAAGNIIGPSEAGEYVNHKGYNTLSIGSHDDSASLVPTWSVMRNPSSAHGDRELPELSANGTDVTALGLTMSGTSFSAPAVAGVVALIQQASNGILRSWPEGCRAILLASAGRNITGSTWWDDVVNRTDGSDGAGAVDAQAGVKIAQSRQLPNSPASVRGYDIGTLTTAEFGADKLATFRYHVAVGNTAAVVKVALAWDSLVTADQSGNPLSSTLTVDLDLLVNDSNGNFVAGSSSYDNSYEIVEFLGAANQTYEIVIRRWSGTDTTWYGVAWNLFEGGISRAFQPALTVQA